MGVTQALAESVAEENMTRTSLLKNVVITLVLALPGTGFALEKGPALRMDPTLLDTLEKFHGHTCAGSLMGARLGLAAKAALQAVGGNGKLKARCFSHSCPVDGIQVAAGTTYGNKAIEVTDENEHRLLLTAEKNWRQVEARLTKGAEEKGKKYREVRAKASGLAVGSPERQRLEKSMEELVHWFKAAPDAEVVQVRVVR